MKKILIPMVAVAFLAACSDEDTNFAAPPSTNATVSSSSEAQLPPTDLSSSSVLPVGDLSSSSVVLPELSSSSVEALPGVSSSSVDALPGVSSSSNGASQFTYVVPKLTALDPTKKYSFYGAELTGLDQFKYGRFEARMKMAALSGTVSSMFVYYDNSWLKEDEPWNEIDIEWLGKDYSVGFSTFDLDLHLFVLTLGLQIKVNICEIFLMLVALLCYNKLAKLIFG